MPSKKIPHTCPICKNKFMAPRKQKRCSYKCAALSPEGRKARSKNMIKLNNNPIIKAKAIASVKIKNSGNNNINWKGGRSIDPNGYIKLLINGKRIKEHRYIMEQFIKRPLTKKEIVHHINGDKHDNRIENLKLLPDQIAHLAEHDFFRNTHK